MSERDRHYPPRPILAASTAVIRDGKVLIARRAKATDLAQYSLPGGLVEIGETIAEAAQRELFEEVGVRADLIAPATYRDIIIRDAGGAVARHFFLVCFAARWIEGEGRPSAEADDIRWIFPRELAGLPVTDGLGDAIAKAFAVYHASEA